ncbi:response regulator transcription factor [Silvimonas sp.]|uniref:response regulator transcription factor n=1 Tax=Silvimonas sp. TaxID=2650811 RepID=UPI00283EB84C|nr:response regulator transcription factor [Silvimonas sp.]MDR3426678.1 response regulator transcription factor [Silvimonas sp.]
MVDAVKSTIFLADDHPTTTIALSAILPSLPNVEIVGQAIDGQAAFAGIVETDPDLVILDLNLPAVDGITLISKIRRRELRCKILVFSATDPRLVASRVALVGGNGFISKDQDVEELLFAVRMVLRGYNCFPNEAQLLAGESNDPTKLLTPRELTVLMALAKGAANKEIAEELHLSEKTVSTHKIRVMEKLDLHSTVELATYARVHGLIF